MRSIQREDFGEANIFPLDGSVSWKQRITTWERRNAQPNAPRECEHALGTEMGDFGKANISPDRLIFPGNNG